MGSEEPIRKNVLFSASVSLHFVFVSWVQSPKRLATSSARLVESVNSWSSETRSSFFADMDCGILVLELSSHRWLVLRSFCFSLISHGLLISPGLTSSIHRFDVSCKGLILFLHQRFYAPLCQWPQNGGDLSLDLYVIHRSELHSLRDGFEREDGLCCCVVAFHFHIYSAWWYFCDFGGRLLMYAYRCTNLEPIVLSPMPK